MWYWLCSDKSKMLLLLKGKILKTFGDRSFIMENINSSFDSNNEE